MAHRRTVSSRHLDMGRIDFDQPPLTPPLHVLNAFNVSLPPTRKARHIWTRTTFLALFALLAIAGYVFFVAQPKLVPIAFGDPAHLSSGAGLSATERLSRLSSHARLAALRHKHTTASLASAVEGPPQIQLTQAQELAAVTSFIASLPQNVIPETVDPSQPVDPQLILDFDTRSPRAAEEVQTMVAETWVQYPVVFFSKLHSPVSREIKQILDDMNLLPSPVYIEVDQRPDEAVLAPLLHRLTNTIELPVLLVGGESAGSVAEIRYLHAKGELNRLVSRRGAKVDGAKKKKGRKH